LIWKGEEILFIIRWGGVDFAHLRDKGRESQTYSNGGKVKRDHILKKSTELIPLPERKSLVPSAKEGCTFSGRGRKELGNPLNGRLAVFSLK